ncbi:MAG: hypothetical protein ABJG98_10145, partial [Ekhidna sp.]
MRKHCCLSFICFALMLIGYNSSAQTVLSIVRADSDPTNATTVNFTVTFQSATTPIAAANFAADFSGTSGVIGAPTTGDNIIYNVPVTGVTGDGTLSIDFVSVAETPITAGYTTGEAYTVDNTSPTPVISSGASDPTNANPIPISVDFSETMVGFAEGDLTIGNGTVTAA